jgi:hypothetical protein
VAWDNSNTHEDDEVEAVVRAAAGQLILLYLPTYSQSLVEPHRDALAPLQARGDPLRTVPYHQGARCGGPRLLRALQPATSRRVLSIIGSDPAEIT